METTYVGMKEDSGNIIFYRPSDGEIILKIDGKNRKLVFPHDSGLEVDGEEILSATITDVTATADEINKLDGAGDIVASGTQEAHIAAAKVDYATPGLDTEAEIIVAFNTTNGKINSILTALEAFGITASA